MSQLWTPNQQQQIQIAFGLNVLPDTSISMQINGLIVPALPAEQIIALADNMRVVAEKAIASRVPIEAGNGQILAVNGQRAVIG